MNASGVYVNLTISYSALGRYPEAMQAADAAYRHDKSVTGHPYFAYALARAQAATGKLQQAETVLRVIAAKKPEVRRDPEFKKVIEFVAAAIEASKGGGQAKQK